MKKNLKTNLHTWHGDCGMYTIVLVFIIFYFRHIHQKPYIKQIRKPNRKPKNIYNSHITLNHITKYRITKQSTTWHDTKQYSTLSANTHQTQHPLTTHAHHKAMYSSENPAYHSTYLPNPPTSPSNTETAASGSLTTDHPHPPARLSAATPTTKRAGPSRVRSILW